MKESLAINNYDVLFKQYFDPATNELLRLVGSSSSYQNPQPINTELLKTGLLKTDNLQLVEEKGSWVILHKEYQAQPDPLLPTRMLVYKAVLLDMQTKNNKFQKTYQLPENTVVGIRQIVLSATKSSKSAGKYQDGYTHHQYQEICLAETELSAFISMFGKMRTVVFGILCQLGNTSIADTLDLIVSALQAQNLSPADIGHCLMEIEDLARIKGKKFENTVSETIKNRNYMETYVPTRERMITAKVTATVKTTVSEEIALKMLRKGSEIALITEVTGVSATRLKEIMEKG
jgi:hypothetical protein